MSFTFEVLSDPLVRDVWDRKYRAPGENSVAETRARVVNGVYARDPDKLARLEALDAVDAGLLIPAGRVNAGAGLNQAVTLQNCFINETVQDSMPGIQRAIARAALTMQQGGGIGTDFSTIRPRGAEVKRTGSVSSGVIPFMDQQSAMCQTIVSGGSRRGAMMGTLRCDHSDLWNPEQFETMVDHTGVDVLKSPSFISAKRQRGRLTQFNVSVLVTDEFLRAVDEDKSWDLGFWVPPADGSHVDVYTKAFPYDEIEYDNEWNALPGKRKKGDMCPWYVYRRMKARQIWHDIMQSTYVYAEPGVMFIDRINERNSLWYCEDIACSNPCFAGETLIVTSEGVVPIRDLVGKEVTIFDGVEWRKVDNFRVTGTNQQMVKITMHDGSSLRVTPAHTMILDDNTRLRADHLVVGTRLKEHDCIVNEWPGIQIPELKSRSNEIVSVEPDGVDEQVYCCTVDGSHSVALGIGITTGNCGEKPMPPNSVCCLSSINLAFLVNHPFKTTAAFDYDKFEKLIHIGVRFLDNVLDVSKYPLKAQHDDAMAKRRIGLGITGFADMLLQLGIRYGSAESVAITETIARMLKEQSYLASAMLARERGPFPLFNRDKFLAGYNAKTLPEDIRNAISLYGIRNGELNTIAPNGTISLYVGNVASGHEPVFSFKKATRKVTMDDGTLKDYESVNYAYRLYEHLNGRTPVDKLPEYFVDANQLSPDEHLKVHAAWQTFIDSAISKTINCAPSMTFDAFQNVYKEAYQLGLKGCTTYRPDPTSGRGSVLSVDEPVIAPTEPEPEDDPMIEFTLTAVEPVARRPDVLPSMVYKLKWPQDGKNWYITITNHDGEPYEMFITPPDAEAQEWVAALSRMVTGILRRGGDNRFIVDQLTEVASAKGGAFIAEDHKFYPSVVAAIGGVLEKEFKRLSEISDGWDEMWDRRMEITAWSTGDADAAEAVEDEPMVPTRDRCGDCGGEMMRQSGCKICLQCGNNTCG